MAAILLNTYISWARRPRQRLNRIVVSGLGVCPAFQKATIKYVLSSRTERGEGFMFRPMMAPPACIYDLFSGYQ